MLRKLLSFGKSNQIRNPIGTEDQSLPDDLRHEERDSNSIHDFSAYFNSENKSSTREFRQADWLGVMQVPPRF